MHAHHVLFIIWKRLYTQPDHPATRTDLMFVVIEKIRSRPRSRRSNILLWYQQCHRPVSVWFLYVQIFTYGCWYSVCTFLRVWIFGLIWPFPHPSVRVVFKGVPLYPIPWLIQHFTIHALKELFAGCSDNTNVTMGFFLFSYFCHPWAILVWALYCYACI